MLSLKSLNKYRQIEGICWSEVLIIFHVYHTVGEKKKWTRGLLGALPPPPRIHYVPHLMPYEPGTHKKPREGSSSPPPINVSCRSANFQQISHEKAGGGLRCAARSGVPGGLTPAAAASWLQLSFGLAGPARCQKLALSPVSGCWFYLSSVS